MAGSSMDSCEAQFQILQSFKLNLCHRSSRQGMEWKPSTIAPKAINAMLDTAVEACWFVDQMFMPVIWNGTDTEMGPHLLSPAVMIGLSATSTTYRCRTCRPTIINNAKQRGPDQVMPWRRLHGCIHTNDSGLPLVCCHA